MENLLHNVEVARIKKTFADGLTSYTLGHCLCTLTDNGYRIYRTPNKTLAADGNVMWGGLVLNNANNRFNLQKGHTYVIQFEVTGQSTNAASDVYWTHTVGWNYTQSGMMPSPSNILNLNPVVANFNDSTWKTFSYLFTVNDDVYKVATATYQAHTLGNTYLSYVGFKFGFTYASTGALGTDLYIKNIRMFDITSGKVALINKQGLAKYTTFVERDGVASIDFGGSFDVNEIIEY